MASDDHLRVYRLAGLLVNNTRNWRGRTDCNSCLRDVERFDDHAIDTMVMSRPNPCHMQLRTPFPGSRISLAYSTEPTATGHNPATVRRLQNLPYVNVRVAHGIIITCPVVIVT